MPKSSTATKKPSKTCPTAPEVTHRIHDLVRDWYAARKEYLRITQVAEEAGEDPSFFRKVLAGWTTGKGTPATFPDNVVLNLIEIAARIGSPINLPRSFKKSA